MSVQKISGWLRHTGTVATVVATATLTTGILAPQASAISLVPDAEGQVDINGGSCSLYPGNPCVTLDPLIKSITSLADSTSGEKSLLFVDDLSTANSYGGGIELGSPDVGTNPNGGEYWFRPVLVSEENGQLEVGTFEFVFSQTLDSLTAEFFDVETWRSTGVLKVNDQDVNQFVVGSANVGDGSLNSMSFTNVNSIVLKLGKDFLNNTGDGVDFRLTASLSVNPNTTKVSEPSAVVGLGAVAVMGLLALRKRKNQQL